MTARPTDTPTAVLCGSVTRAVAALDAAERHYLAQGYTVHKPVADPSRSPEEHAERWYALIDTADVVVACRHIGAQFGSQTQAEVGYATSRGKEVLFYRHGLREERAS
ncbi:nucleoside 2-deoxyribosyltransferase [Saccharothrix coeruleofusca]|uniref:hypothetical protein n=1 Tax=Saccharothrix coeruleofusca TaxID=33919 RepID=UPI001AE1C725|nr:hypothetical protein [Saccharothrix coeruleofusca]MBP2341069.1 nucleoside 2-deoxyribosyltransferase [Saccharothrix coeruleofusca]